jgi:hypothetical protein
VSLGLREVQEGAQAEVSEPSRKAGTRNALVLGAGLIDDGELSGTTHIPLVPCCTAKQASEFPFQASLLACLLFSLSGKVVPCGLKRHD